jgi:hypothetical protein
MNRWLTYFIALLCFLSISVIGWNWGNEDAAGWMKFHPVTYLAFLGAALGLGSLRMTYWRPILTPAYGLFGIMALVLTVRAAMIAASTSEPTGAISVAITTFLTPFLFLIASAGMREQDWMRAGAALRVFFVLNSLIALGEAAFKTSLVFVQEGHLFRAGGLIGHPLSSAMATGFMLVYLLTASNRKKGLVTALPEVILHAAAMFAFGGRTGLILVPIVVAINTILPAPGIPSTQRIGRRVAILALLIAGLLATQLQIDVIQNAMTRFESDSGSADTRLVALRIARELPLNDFLFGLPPGTRDYLMLQYGLTVAIENPYITLVLMFGVFLTLGMVISLLVMIFNYTRKLDRSATMVVVYFLIFSSGNVSFGTRSITIMQVLVFVSAMCRPRQSASPLRRDMDTDMDIMPAAVLSDV